MPVQAVYNPSTLSFGGLCDRFVDATKPAYEKRQKGYTAFGGITSSYRPKRTRKDAARSGDKRLDRLQQTLVRLETFGWALSKQQRIMVNGMICAALPQIMQEDLQLRMEYLMDLFGVEKKLKPEVLIKATRRLGKTTAAALFITAYADSQPDAEADIYSVARRTSVMFLAKIVKLLIMLHDGDTSFILRYNQEEFKFINSTGTVATIHSYPAASKIDTRGGDWGRRETFSPFLPFRSFFSFFFFTSRSCPFCERVSRLPSRREIFHFVSRRFFYSQVRVFFERGKPREYHDKGVPKDERDEGDQGHVPKQVLYHETVHTPTQRDQQERQGDVKGGVPGTVEMIRGVPVVIRMSVGPGPFGRHGTSRRPLFHLFAGRLAQLIQHAAYDRNFHGVFCGRRVLFWLFIFVVFPQLGEILCVVRGRRR